MRLDDHRTTGGQGGCRVATGDGKGQREVARAEYRHRAESDMALSQIGARQRLAIRQGRVDAHIEPLAGAHRPGKQPQLPAGAPALPQEPCLWQPGFHHCAFDQVIADRLDLVGHGLEKGGTRLQRGVAVIIERRPGQLAGPLDVGLGPTRIPRLERLVRGR